MTHTFNYSINSMFEEIEKFTRLQKEYEEQTLTEIIEKYDFVVGSKECKVKLMEILPEGANIICLPYIKSPTTVYAIKKFDAMDLLPDPYTAESDIEIRKPCINYEDGCEEWAGCPCVHYKAESEE